MRQVDWLATRNKASAALIGAEGDALQRGLELLKRLRYAEKTCYIVSHAKPYQRESWEAAAEATLRPLEAHLILQRP